MRFIRQLTLVWCFLLCFVKSDDLFGLSDDVKVAVRSQRDLMKNITIDQLPLPGVSLADVIVWNTSNKTEPLDILLGLLYNGIQTLKVDLTYGNDEIWYISGSEISVSTFLSTVQTYMEDTNTDLYTNVLLVLFEFDARALNQTSSIQDTNFTSLILESISSNYICSFDDLLLLEGLNKTSLENSSTDISWISLDEFLFDYEWRIIFGFLNGENITSTTDDTIVFPASIFDYVTDNSTLKCPLSSLDEIETVTQKQWRFLEGNFTSEEFLPYYECGYSPVITNHYMPSVYSELKSLVDSSILWTWNTSDPTSELPSTASSSGSSIVYTAYYCGAYHQSANSYDNSWIMANCYDKMLVLCNKSGQTNSWNFTSDAYTYFSAGQKGVCPTGYEFATPETPLQQRSIQVFMDENDISISRFWIDISSLASNDCWVTGWLSARCPYDDYDITNTLLIMTTPASIVAFLLVVVIFYFNWARVPIQDNRKSWNRVINAYAKEEVDGVPS